MATWQFTLLDQLSGPARAADRALEALQGELSATDKALRSLNTTAKQARLNQALGLDITSDQKAHTKSVLDGIRAQRLRLGIQRDEQRASRVSALEARAHLSAFDNFKSAISPIQAVRSKIDELKTSLGAAAQNGGLFRSAMSSAGSVLGTLATGAAALGVGVAALGASFVVSTAKAADFGETQRRNLMQRFGAVEGARQYEILIEYANRYGTSLQETFQQFNLLSTKGFNSNQIIAMMQGAGDAATVMGHQASESILNAIGQIKGKGVAQMEELQQQLAERGINIESVLSEIGRSRGGISGARVRQLIRGGQIQAMEAIPAVFRTIQRDFSQGGPMGTAMLNRTHTLAGTIDLIKTRWEIFQTRVGETSAFAPVTSFLGKIAEMMNGNTESGRKFQEQLNSMFTGLFGDVGKQDPVKLFQDITGTIREAGAAAKVFLDIFIAAGKAMTVVAQIMNEMRPGKGTSMDESMRAARGSGPSNLEILAARLDEQAGGPAAPAVPPTAVPSAQNMVAQRNVNVGGIHLTIDAGAVQSGGATPAEVGRQAADAAHEQLSRHLNAASMSQGNPT